MLLPERLGLSVAIVLQVAGRTSFIPFQDGHLTHPLSDGPLARPSFFFFLFPFPLFGKLTHKQAPQRLLHCMFRSAIHIHAGQNQNVSSSHERCACLCLPALSSLNGREKAVRYVMYVQGDAK